MLFDVKCTLNVSLSVNCAVLLAQQDTYFQIEENVSICLIKYLKNSSPEYSLLIPVISLLGLLLGTTFIPSIRQHLCVFLSILFFLIMYRKSWLKSK